MKDKCSSRKLLLHVETLKRLQLQQVSGAYPRTSDCTNCNGYICGPSEYTHCGQFTCTLKYCGVSGDLVCL